MLWRDAWFALGTPSERRFRTRTSERFRGVLLVEDFELRRVIINANDRFEGCEAEVF